MTYVSTFSSLFVSNSESLTCTAFHNPCKHQAYPLALSNIARQLLAFLLALLTQCQVGSQIHQVSLLLRPWSGVTDHLAVGIGTQLLGIVPGRVSTECDAHLSYDTQGTIDKVTGSHLTE